MATRQQSTKSILGNGLQDGMLDGLLDGLLEGFDLNDAFDNM